MKGLSWPSWLTCSGRFTHVVVTRRLQAERRTGSVRRPKTGVLPTVLCNHQRIKNRRRRVHVKNSPREVIRWFVGFKLTFVNEASPVAAADVVLSVGSTLQCGRVCLMEPQCRSFTIGRNVAPVSDVTCHLYYQLPSLQYDAAYTTYVTGNSTLPTEWPLPA